MNLRNSLNTVFFNFFKDQVFIYPSLRIAITYRCNQSCPYCSSYFLKSEFPADMTLEAFESVVAWAARQGARKVLLTGGEPFFHSRFSVLLEICRKYSVCADILTNGLLLGDHADECLKAGGCSLILNVNLDESFEKLKRNIRGVEGRIKMLRYNLRKECHDYEELFLLAKQLSVPVRFGFTVPSLCPGNEHYGFKDMFENKSQIIDFVDKALRRSVSVNFARPLPRCLLTEKEWRRLSFLSGIKSRCLPGKRGQYALRAIVNPDLSVFGCYAGLFKAGSLLDFKDFSQLNAHFSKVFDSFREKPLLEECLRCRYFKDKSCQGGCLAYKCVS